MIRWRFIKTIPMILSVVCGFYLAEQKLDEKQAKEVLKQHFEKIDKEQWGWNIVEFYPATLANKR